MALSRQQKITAILLAFYWPALFVVAHIPIPQVVRKAGVSDKSLHFLAYLVLALLLWFAVSGDKKVKWRRAAPWWVLFVMVVYGIFDEWSQGYVAGRSCDARDFFADLAGTLAGLILFSACTFWPAALVVTATAIFAVANIARANLADLMPVANAVFHLLAYAILTMLWIQCMHLFLPTIRLRRTKLKWLIAASAAPTAFLLTVELFSVILDKEFSVPEITISAGAIGAVVVASYLRALFYKTQDAEDKGFGP
jgi:VanZ family protein